MAVQSLKGVVSAGLAGNDVIHTGNAQGMTPGAVMLQADDAGAQIGANIAGMTDGVTAQDGSSVSQEQGSGFTNTLASAYHKATSAYNHVMDPIHKINEYVDRKNELDASFANGEITNEIYEQNVKDLQTDYFGDDESRLNIASKFEAVQDWQDAHGITKIRESVAGVTAGIREAFARTSIGQKFEDIKLAAAQMDDAQNTGNQTTESASVRDSQTDTEDSKKTSEDKASSRARIARESLGIMDDHEDESISADAQIQA